MSDTTRAKIILYGAGGHAAVVEAAIHQNASMQCAAIIDDGVARGTLVVYQEVSGSRADLPELLAGGMQDIHIAIGNNATRARLASEVCSLGFKLLTVRHPASVVDSQAEIGAGSFLAVGSIIGTRTEIGEGCIINTAATVDHDCIIGAFTHICPGVHLAGEVRVGERTMIGTGAVVIPQITIGDDCIIGAGAVVIRDIASGTTVVGVPARTI